MRSHLWLSFALAAILLTAALCAAKAQESPAAEPGGKAPKSQYVFKTVGERELKIHLDYPPDWKPTDRRPAIVFFFGGGWTSGSVGQFETQAAYFAGRGLVAARADYRVKSRDKVTPDKCVEDARSAVRWIRQHAGRLGVDPGRLIASGGSAGGHLAACTMIAKSVDAPDDDLSVSTVPQAMVLFNPVLSLDDDRMAVRLGGDRQLARKISPTVHLDKKAPPALILFGTNDRLKVYGDAYWEKAKTLGVRADKFLAEGQGHGFFNRSPWRERTTIAADRFLASLGLLKGEPTIKVPPQQPASEARDNSQNRNPGAAAEKIVARWLSMDKDGDGKITKDEAQGRLKAGFDRYDTNKDGSLDRTELDALAQRLFGGRRGTPGRRPNTPRNSRSTSNEELLKRAPEGVTVVPDVAYREGNDAWKLDLAMPSQRGDRPRPAIVFVHGGGWRSGDKRAGNFIGPAMEFAGKGYVCISVNYRLVNENTSITACIEDVKCAVRWLRAHADKYNLDPERVGAYGNSAGAHLVAMLGLCPASAGLEGDGPWQEHSSMVQAVVCSATPTSFLIPMSNRARRRRDQQSDGPADAAPRNTSSTMSEKVRKQISPITYVGAQAPPFLLVHEASDPVVGVYHSENFVKALREAGAKDVTFKRYEDGSGHGAFGANIKQTGPAREAFFTRTLLRQP